MGTCWRKTSLFLPNSRKRRRNIPFLSSEGRTDIEGSMDLDDERCTNWTVWKIDSFWSLDTFPFLVWGSSTLLWFYLSYSFFLSIFLFQLNFNSNPSVESVIFLSNKLVSLVFSIYFSLFLLIFSFFFFWPQCCYCLFFFPFIFRFIETNRLSKNGVLHDPYTFPLFSLGKWIHFL